MVSAHWRLSKATRTLKENSVAILLSARVGHWIGIGTGDVDGWGSVIVEEAEVRTRESTIS